MIHERLDLARWIAEYPLSAAKVETDLGPNIDSPITGPLAVAYAEQVRSEARARGHNLGPPVPIDLCVWMLGDCKRRDVTKIGGVPYWPDDEPWPFFRYGPAEPWVPYTFVAQFCFADSSDLVPALPGDILCILALRPNLVDLSLHWFRLGKRRLWPAEDLPEPGWEFESCHAVLHRAAEYPSARKEWFEAIDLPRGLQMDLRRPRSPTPWDWIEAYPKRLQDAWYFRHATKIGGVWWSNSEIPDPDGSEEDSEWRASLQRAQDALDQQEREFICQMIPPSPSKQWPFLNVARLDDLTESERQLVRGVSEGQGFVSVHHGTDGTYAETDWGG